jgi:hypothetical protein
VSVHWNKASSIYAKSRWLASTFVACSTPPKAAYACLPHALRRELGVKLGVPVALGKALFHDRWPAKEQPFPNPLHA